ncbi:MAG: hypothetical protein WC231_05020 [Dehalococcoidales bacterium]
MSWFKRHLNGTLLISFFTAPLLYVVATFILALLFNPSSEESAWFVIVLGWIAGVAYLLFVAAWVSKNKGRSAAWCLLLFVPLGFLGLLALKNKAEDSWTDGVKGYFHDKPLQCPYCGSKNYFEYIAKRAESEEEKRRLGYSYLWEGRCSNCNQAWRYPESNEKSFGSDAEKRDNKQDSRSIYCSGCGNAIAPDMTFCSQCGRKV